MRERVEAAGEKKERERAGDIRDTEQWKREREEESRERGRGWGRETGTKYSQMGVYTADVCCLGFFVLDYPANTQTRTHRDFVRLLKSGI